MLRSSITKGAAMRRAGFILSAIILASACHNDATDATAPVPALVGRVMNSAIGYPVAGVEVIVGTSKDTTDGNGRFAFTRLPPGPAKLKVATAGFEPFETDVTVTSGDTVVPDVSLKRIELFNAGDFAIYVPANVGDVDAVLLALGGPDTRGFAAGTPFGAPLPQVEASLQEFGQKLRLMAETMNLVVIGTSRAAMANSAESDQALADAIKTAAAASGRREIANVPILMYGMSGGGPEASGFTARHPERVLGLFLKAPLDVESLSTATTRAVPTYMVLEELDAFVDNSKLTAKFETNRNAGALWAAALEPGVPHHFLTLAQQDVTQGFMYDVLSARVPGTSGALTTVSESIGWLGNPNTREVAAWSSYGGDRRSAAWFLSGAEAEQWRAFSAPMMATIRQADSLMIWADLKLGWQPSVANLAAGGTVHWETAGPLSWSDVPQRMLYFMDEKYTTVDSLDLSTGSARRAFPTPGDYRYCSAGCWDPPDFGIIHVH